jgi:hypothetical protein
MDDNDSNFKRDRQRAKAENESNFKRVDNVLGVFPPKKPFKKKKEDNGLGLAWAKT